MRYRSFMFLALPALALPLSAQQQPAPRAEVVDRIIAVVGDSIVFAKDVEEEFQRALDVMRSRQEPVPTDSSTRAALRKDILNQIVDQLVLLQAALRDSALVAQVDETALGAEVDKEINERRQRMGGPGPFEAALQQQRLTFTQYREMMLADMRKQTLVQRYLQKLSSARKPPPISEKELKAEFDRQKASFPPRPPTIIFEQVVLLPTASDSARARARAKADSLLTQVRTGGDFAALAKRFSDDTGSKELGGDLGWDRPSRWVKEFADAVMYLRPGEISPVVETSYGFHIIKLEKVRGGERQVRHILITPETSEDDAGRALTRGQDVAAKVRAGANVDSLNRAVGDANEPSRVGPIERAKLAEISAEYAQALADAKNGEVVGPFAVGAGAARKAVIVKVVEVREGGEYTVDDPVLNFRRQIEQRRLVSEIIDELRRQTYIEIRQ